MTDLICVDVAAQEDLMLQDQLARAVLERARGGDRLLILLGSGEAEERRLETAGHPTKRADGALTVVTEAVEVSMRESVRLFSNRLTDEGVYAVGMLAGDRGLVAVTDSGLQCSPRFEQRVWTGPGVVPVMGCLSLNEAGESRDLHPLKLGEAVAECLDDEVRLIMLAQRQTPSLKVALESNEAVSAEKMAAEGAFCEGLPRPSDGAVWYTSHVTEMAAGRMAKIR